MRDLPRQLSVDELAELFEGRTRFVERLAELERPARHARDGRRDAHRGREARGARRASGDRRAHRALRALGRRAGRRRRPGGARRARAAERRVRGAVRLPLRRLRQPPAEGGDPRVLRERLERTARRGAGRPPLDELVAIAEDRWRRALALARLLVTDWLDLVFRWFHVDRGDRLDRHVVLLRRARQPPAAAGRASATPSAASAASRGRSTAAASTASRSSGRARRRCPSRCTGSSGRRTGRGSPASRCSSSSTTSHAAQLPDRPDRRRPRAVGGDRDLVGAARRRLARLRRALPACSAGQRAGRSRVASSRSSPSTAWAVGQLFAPRARLPRRSARCSARSWPRNVLFVIIPAHWELVRAKEAGREPDPRRNARGKQRSVHNNYLTLPVLFAMLAGHFPFTYGHDRRLARARRADGARRAGSATTSTCATRQDALVDPGGAPPASRLAVLCDPTGRAVVGRARDGAGAAVRAGAARSSSSAARRATRPSRRSRVHRAAGGGIVLDTPEQIESHAAQIKAVAVRRAHDAARER